MRLDQAVAASLGISRRRARSLIAEGRVLVNHRPVRIASRPVDDAVALTINTGSQPIPQPLASGDDWIAVDKPAGVPTQPTRSATELSLEDVMREGYGEIYLIHRLDTPTSGVVLFARTREAAARFSRLFATGAMRKTYLAVIDGELSEERVIDTPIAGQEARTIVRPLRGSLIEVKTETGRTHQIRIHLASIGHPVKGDRRYGGSAAPRLMLHAWKLAHESVGAIEAPIPNEFPPL